MPIPRDVLALGDQVLDHLAAVDDFDRTVARRHQPQVIGLITTGLSELQGADIPRTLAAFRAAHPEHGAVTVVPVATPDADGCLESGYALAVKAMIEALVPASRPLPLRPARPQVTVLTRAGFTREPGSEGAMMLCSPWQPVQVGESLEPMATALPSAWR
mgnify:CR=1 FL=1